MIRHSQRDLPEHGRDRRRRLARGVGLGALLLLVLGMAFGTVRADSYDERRVRSAARLMRSLLAADEGLQARHPDGTRVRVLVLADSQRQADPLIALIAPTGDPRTSQISGLAMDVTTGLGLPNPDLEPPDAVFLAEPLANDDFDNLLAWCIARRVILYSPFEGDVERGATAGLSIQAKVQPFVNRHTLDASGITLRSFFIDHSRVWP